jgi:hypothetical protein
MNDGIEAFRSQLQKELGLSIGPKDPLLALWVSQRELLEQNAAQQQKLLSEFQAALGKSQTAWSEQAKALAQQSLNAGLQAPLARIRSGSRGYAADRSQWRALSRTRGPVAAALRRRTIVAAGRR